MEPHTSSYLSKYIVSFFDYIDDCVPLTLITKLCTLEVSCWPDLLIKSTVEPKRCLILDVRKSSLVEDRRVPENRNEFPFPLPSCLYGAIVVVPPTRVQFNCARKPLVTQALSLSNVKTGGLI